MPARPGADVVVPFRGDPRARVDVEERLASLRLQPGDTVRVEEDRPRRGSYSTRNRAAAAGANPWIVFLDADVVPPADLLDRLLGGAIDDGVAVLGADVADAPPSARPTLAERYAHLTRHMSQDRTFERPEFAYVQTACCAVRRDAFESAGGFAEDIRSGGDAELCFRLRAAGWRIERRREAEVVHRSRRTLRAFLGQRARVGAGARWLEDRYPGFSPHQPLLRSFAGNLRIAARGALRRGDEGLIAVFEGLGAAAFQLGARVPNRPLRATPRSSRSKPL